MEFNYNPISDLNRMRHELVEFNTKITQKEHSYELINNTITEHIEKIKKIFSQVVENQEISTELQNYSLALNQIFSHVSKNPTIEKTQTCAFFTILKMKKKVNEAALLNRMILVFSLSKEELEKLIVGGKGEAYFEKAANVCFELTTQRLYQQKALTFKEIKDIYELLFDSKIKNFSQKRIQENDPINPHPVYVFTSLQQCSQSFERFKNCKECLEQVEIYLQNKPNNNKFEKLFKLTLNQQKSALEGLKVKAEEGNIEAETFIKELNIYKQELKNFQEGLKKFPIINIKTLFKESININQTFFLNGNEKIQWVFKPIKENNEEIVQAECISSQLNFHHQFPIPLTLKIEVKEWVGSCQMYVEGAKILKEVQLENLPISKIELQKLVVFDLLFANSDRNQANFLFKKSEENYKIIGIDHDSCLMFREEIQPLRLEYLGLEELNAPFDKEILELFPPQTLEKYEKIMKENKVSESQIEWLKTAANMLNKGIEKQKSVIEVIKKTIKAFKENFLN